MPAFRVKLGTSDLNCVDVPLNPTHFGTGQGVVTLCGWEGNRRSGVASAMHHRLRGLSTYRLSGLSKGDKHPPTVQV